MRNSGGRSGTPILLLGRRQLVDGEGMIFSPFYRKNLEELNFRIVSMIAISLTLYGGGCVFIVLIAQLLGSLAGSAGFSLSLCVWMVIVAVGLTPMTWMGTPKDFWPIAVGALSTTCIACLLIVITCILDGNKIEEKNFPDPTADGMFKGKERIKLGIIHK